MDRGRRGAFVIGVALGVVVAAIAVAPRTADQRLAEAQRLAEHIGVEVVVDRSTLMATTAIADFGVGAEVRLVRVRIVDELDLTLTLTASAEVELAGPPRLCLVGPDAAPDDAGLSDRCWGEPDLTTEFEGLLGGGTPRSTSVGGPLTVRPGEPVVGSVSLRRGMARCDYPPGTWQLEVWLAPVVDGLATAPILAATPSLAVPILDPSRPVVLDRGGRFCGLADRLYLEQGEPEVMAP